MRLVCLAVLLGLTSSTRAADPPASLRTFLDEHCVRCHAEEKPKGNLRLDRVGFDLSNADQLRRWVRIHDRVASGEMPPASVKTRPTAEGSKAFLAALAGELTRTETAARQGSGRTLVRRLTRTEYENTLRDLLHLPTLSVKDLLPDDGRYEGYDKAAQALDISPILMAKYAEAADAALQQAIAAWSVPPEVTRATMYGTEQYDYKVLMSNGDAVILKDFKYDPRFPLQRDKPYGGMFPGLGEAERAGIFKEPGTVGVFRQQDEAFPGRFHFAPLYPGKYRVTLSVWSFWWNKGEVLPSARTGAAGLYLGPKLLGHFDAPSKKQTTHDMEVWLPAGTGYFTINAASLWPVRVSETKGQAAEYVGPGLAIDSLTVEGPLFDEWPPESHTELFGRLPLVPFSKLDPKAPKPKRSPPQQIPGGARNHTGRLVFGTVLSEQPEADATRLLSAFLPKLFRRPVIAEEVAGYVGIARQRLNQGDSFEDALRWAYKTALCSPDFLFLRERPGALDDDALASRLAYFLWAGPPDATLTRLAREGKLHEPAILREQVRRMLGDPRAERFYRDFLDQWLDLRDFDQTTPDRTLYPEFQPYLRDAIQQEPLEYFREMIKSNRNVTQLVRSDFVMVNQRLAEHYGIPGVEGTRFRGVGAPPGSHRGGLLTTAAVMKVTANGTTTSPVKRGAWVIKKILGQPPEPPPPEVSAIEPDVRGTTTIRELLTKHRDQPSCAACHARIDPPGFALESYDVIGGYRARYRATQGKEAPDWAATFPSHRGPDGTFNTKYYHAGFRLGLPVDASGETARGENFAGIDQFKELLVKDPRPLAQNLVRQLTLYSTGSPASFADRPAIDAIIDKAGGNGAGVRSLIEELVLSPLFLTK